MILATQIAEARAALEALERQAVSATCVELGHDWQIIGGRWCGCPDGACSVPVHTCMRCGDCDYGDTPEADQIKAACNGEGDL